MNALNISSRPEVHPALRPLVFTTRPGRYYWVERGYGFVLDARSFGTWGAVVGELCGGHVLTASQVASLVATFGSPVMPEVMR